MRNYFEFYILNFVWGFNNISKVQNFGNVEKTNDGSLVLNQGNADKEISHCPISHQTFLMMVIDQTNSKEVIPVILHAPECPRLLFPI